ncbi:MAG: hypothetical protein IKE61_01325 [Coriobacteriales bacterium]|nr:hypothetical protein [Coriobacteriales bacterium]
MARYRCPLCGYIFDEEKEGKTLEEMGVCPLCKKPYTDFELVEEEPAEEAKPAAAATPAPSGDASDLSYDSAFSRKDDHFRYMDEIQQIAVTGKTIHAAMATKLPLPSWDDILMLGAQLDPAPLDDGAPVSTETIIGRNAAKPMVLATPIFISHMSYGALSKEAKVALAMGSARVKTAMCSGEGGILPEERNASYKYIFEYVPNKYSASNENLKDVDAIEIKIGQGTKPGMGGHLPGEKVTPEIAKIRGRAVGQDIQSPSKFPDINEPVDLLNLVDRLRWFSEGRPIGIKIAAGNLERDLAWCLYAHPDFITIDGRGGATGSSPLFLRDSTSIPTIYALARARKFLDENDSDIALVITGGLRISADFAKAIAMGADAVAIASAAKVAMGCMQYRICGSGNCPVGIATQDPELRARFDENKGAARVANFLRVSTEELKTFARISGVSDIHSLSMRNLVTVDPSIAEQTGIAHVGRPQSYERLPE